MRAAAAARAAKQIARGAWRSRGGGLVVEDQLPVAAAAALNCGSPHGVTVASQQACRSASSVAESSRLPPASSLHSRGRADPFGSFGVAPAAGKRPFASTPHDKFPDQIFKSSRLRDDARVLSEDQLTEASKLLLRLAVTSGVDGALFTQAALPAESKAGGTREYAVELLNRTGLGKRGEDRGLLVLLLTEERALEVVTGDGISLDEASLAEALSKDVRPLMQQPGPNGPAAGAVAALRLCADALERDQRQGRHGGGDADAPTTAAHGRTEQDRGGGGESGEGRFTAGTAASVGIGAAAGYLAYKALRDRRRRTCPACGAEMRPLPATTLSAELDPCQLLEQELGATQFSRFRCGRCSEEGPLHADAVATSQYGPCEFCGCRASAADRREVRPASREYEGTLEIETSCRACGRRDVREERIPRLMGPAEEDRRQIVAGGDDSGGGKSSGGGASLKY